MSTNMMGRAGLGAPATGFWLFLLLAAIYLLSYSGGFHSIDEVSVAAMTESLVKHGQVTTDQLRWSEAWTPSQGRLGPDGHLYSKKGIGTAVLGAPFYWLALHLPEMGQVRALMLASALVTALTGWLLYSCVRLLGYRPVAAALAALGYGLATMAWPYAKYFFSEPLTAMGLMAGLWGLLAYRQRGQARYAFVAGAGLAMTLLAKVANLMAWPLFLAYGVWIALGRRQKDRTESTKAVVLGAAAFLLPLIVAGLVLAAYNLARSGNPLDLGYAADETFTTPLWQGLAGFLLSPGKSLFLYSPILVAALFGVPALLHRDWAIALLSLGVAVVYPLVYAAWFMWWGGWSWGPRFLVPVLPFLCLFLAPVAEWALQPRGRWARGILAAVVLVSLSVQILGVTVDFNEYMLLLYQRGLEHGEINFRPELSPILGHWDLFRIGRWDLAWARDLSTGVDWPRLLWPLALVVGVLVGWSLGRRIGPMGRWLLAASAIGLLAVSMATVTRVPATSDDWQLGSQELSALLLGAAKPNDVMIVDFLPYGDHLYLATSLLERYKALPAYWGWARQEPVSMERGAFLEALGQEYRRLWLALDTTPQADPASATERWLDERAFRVEEQWLSPALRLVRYELPVGSADGVVQSGLDLQVGDWLWLKGYTLAGPLESRPGDVLAFSLLWQAEDHLAEDYVVFVQLLDGEGRLRAQVDREPVGGFRPTSTWQPGEVIRDNYGLPLPSDLPAGDYQLIAGLYLPVSQERLAVRAADGVLLGDYAVIASVSVAGGDSP